MFEDALVSISPQVTIPYWNWANNPRLPDPLADAAEWGVTRGDEISPKRKDDVALAISKTMFAAFHDRINGPHGAVHLQIGGVNEQTGFSLGEMTDIERSPHDVLFWLQNAFLDKLWNDWSKRNPGKFPTDGLSPLTNINAPLQPTNLCTRTSRQVFTIKELGYSYE